MNKTKYKEHIQFTNKLKDEESLNNEESIIAFKRLLDILPNKGKLYKYKSGKGKSFLNTYKSLKEGYIWMTNVLDFNDRFDSTINFDYNIECDKLAKYLRNNKNIVLRYHLKREKEHPETRYFSTNDFHNNLLLTVSQFTDNKGRIDKFGL